VKSATQALKFVLVFWRAGAGTGGLVRRLDEGRIRTYTESDPGSRRRRRSKPFPRFPRSALSFFHFWRPKMCDA